jgi:hypothetical protein
MRIAFELIDAQCAQKNRIQRIEPRERELATVEACIAVTQLQRQFAIEHRSLAGQQANIVADFGGVLFVRGLLAGRSRYLLASCSRRLRALPLRSGSWSVAPRLRSSG